jgi:hypothetical protein
VCDDETLSVLSAFFCVLCVEDLLTSQNLNTENTEENPRATEKYNAI